MQLCSLKIFVPCHPRCKGSAKLKATMQMTLFAFVEMSLNVWISGFLPIAVGLWNSYKLCQVPTGLYPLRV